MLNRQEAGKFRLNPSHLAVQFLLINMILAACSPVPVSPTPLLETRIPSPSETRIPTPTKTQVARSTAVMTGTASPVPTSTSTPKPVCATRPGTVTEVSLDNTMSYDPIEFLIYLPPCYKQETIRTYPLLVLFHGIYDSKEQWLRIGIVEAADRLIISQEVHPFIIMMPYDPNPRSPEGTFFDEIFFQEMIPYVTANFRITSGPGSRALGGISRGAGWAIHFGLQNPDLFSAIGAHSPIIFSGDYPELDKWLDAIPARKLPGIYLDIGDHDPNREGFDKLKTLFEDHGLQIDVNESPGYHSEDYWKSQVEDYLRWYAAGW